MNKMDFLPFNKQIWFIFYRKQSKKFPTTAGNYNIHKFLLGVRGLRYFRQIIT